ncbi:3-phosphoinositide-dependent protein kinase 2-like isoform X1 [Canna indica]|uniref:non-specific serine/threonine protein kinase n=1 Tax=Canna indica TaxID=4628 RepID=A0AAQ3QPJ9_9LILI|nr:3-phosphoinositide-dependent protein kinase 2-like isoform X1 [Canna indica]
MTTVGADGEEEMERDFEAKLRLQQPSMGGVSSKAVQRTNSIAFRAPQEQFTIDDFELGKVFGVGSYSKVVRAKKKDTRNVYALKIMDKKFIAKENKVSYVKMERIVLDQLDHPGIIRLCFTFQDSYSLYMALECCEGGELFDQITRKGRLSEDEARFYAAEVVDALEYIHGMGLIHRDIKPENLLLTIDGHIKIADFGSVKPTRDSQITVLPNSANEKACTFVGTAAYIPPEVLNSSPATLGNDLWALGCTLYQMLSGSSPFKDASEWLIFQKIIARDLKFPEYFSHEARDLIDKLLFTKLSDRAQKGTCFMKFMQFMNARQEFLEPGEVIIMISMLKKIQKLSNKKVQLILTDKPKLLLVDPSKMTVKASIVWSDNPSELNVQVTNSSYFKICTPKKVISFEDAKQRAWQWKKAIEGLQHR